MIGDWVAQTPAFVAAAAVVFVPGLAIGYALRLRGMALWALAPVGSTVLLSVFAIGFGLIDIPWNPWTAGIGCLVATGAAILSARAFGPRRRSDATPTTSRWLLATALAAGIVLGALRVGFYIREPAAISQSNDAVFHLNALRWILEQGSASSLDVSAVVGGRSFYPAAWHALSSLTVQLSGAEISVAANMVSIVIAAVIWPLGIAWFTRQATGGSIVAAALAAALSPLLLAFPLLMLAWGVLYPYALSVALLPAAVGIVVSVPAWIEGSGPLERRSANAILGGVLVLAGLGALALSQPAVLLAWGVLAVVWFAWWALPRARVAAPRRRMVLFGSVGAALLTFAGLWIVLTRGTTGSHWPPFRGRIEVLADVLLNAPVLLPAAVGVSILMLVGLVVAVRRADLRWLATSWLVLAGLYGVSAAVGQPQLRRWLLGAWYADPYRLAALLPVVVIPLAAIGLLTVVTWAAGALSARRAGTGTAAAIASIAAVGTLGLVVAPVVHMPRLYEDLKDARSLYESRPASFLSPDERALLEQLDELVPAGARVIGNPSTGVGFGYLLSGRDVYPRTWAPPARDWWWLLAERMNLAATDDEVCAALESAGSPAYVLDFGLGEEGPGKYVMPGMTAFAHHAGFELVAEKGDVSLWRITACSP
jgi:hypothetical protein